MRGRRARRPRPLRGRLRQPATQRGPRGPGRHGAQARPHRADRAGPERSVPAQYARTFADVGRGELLLYEDAGRRLSVAVSHGDAAVRLGVTVDDELQHPSPVTDVDPRPAPAASAQHRLDQLARAGARPRRRAARHAGHRRSRARGAAARAAAGPPRRAARCCARCVVRDPPRLIPLARRGRRRRGGGRAGAGQMAQRRAHRRAQGRGHPRRGAAAGALGGGRHRPQRRPAPPRTSPTSCATARPRWASGPRRSSRPCTGCSARWRAGWRRRPRRCWPAVSERDALRGRRSAGRRDRVPRTGSTARAGCGCSPATE